MTRSRIGIIGCGNISDIYLKNLTASDKVEVIAVADADLSRARMRAEQYSLPHAYSVDELLADPNVDIVVNLTIPKAHAEISLRALEAGKHVYGEKPLAVTMEEGARVMALADAKGLRVACAPETFLGGGIQSCRKLIDDGAIGRPVAATGFMMSGGHERWHPDPAFYYEVGGGPMFDMGPYYLTAFVTLLGPIRRVTGSAVITHEERTITSEPKRGQKIRVETPTHIAGVIDFASGAVGTLITSFDIAAGAGLPPIEIYGTAGTLRVPDPNNFGGEIQLRKAGSSEWQSIPLTHGLTDNCRGIGVIDLAEAIAENRPHRAHGAMAYHVLEAMHGFHIASNEDRHYQMTSSCEQPAAMSANE
ncbi:putative dehydrogenase [Paenibacillus cellulosilyticus]|uniref:Putative dehydrogenase n=1 Tax=Paenibacillus cellulosilyticus TaxID=375489 RepID=A0A2V2YC30_9BACL|nr:Gfo/Idh/MocA family oxidoreductase [Paenibacillus cellulosilyticus]PWV89354.1 putative dehydrogenase [Paenibacillus cellulosilyticus]QKS47309.1 Gfo/Idh/MocA family oxidoreductase [Paenibacillus cellulosilyticus]